MGKAGIKAISIDVKPKHEEMESEENWNVIFDMNPLPMVILDNTYHLLETNHAYEELMRKSKDQLLRMDAKDYRIKFLSGDKTEKTFLEGKTTKCDLEIVFKDGTKKVVEQYGVPLAKQGGAVFTAFFVFNDITGQREKESEVQAQMARVTNLQKRSETIVQQNPMPMLLLSTDFKILVANDAYVQMSGISYETLHTMSARDFKVLEQRGEGLKQVVQQKKRSYGEVTVELPSGVHILEQYGIPIQNDKGDLLNILIVYKDITENRKKEKEVELLMEESRKKAELLARSAHEVGTTMSALAKGDVTKILTIEENDPLATIKQDYNTSILSIRSILEQISTAVQQVENTTKDVSRSNVEISKATEQVANSTQQSSDYARKQMELIEGVSREISDLSASIEEIASTSHEVMNRAQTATKEGNTAKDLGNQASARMQAVEKIARQSVEEINRLNEKMREISNVVRLITDIANQTNLLALNAAIEAARAGEHGRGFAVVAGEVRNLAGEAKQATQHIEEVISGITASSASTAASMKNAYGEVSSGIDIVSKTIEVLNRIIAEIEVVANGITEISHATESQANATNRVMERMDEVNHLTKESMRKTEDMAALAEEVNASTEEVASGSHELSDMADQLKTTVEQFTLR
jgi:methyl-accepting chemotaxis protein